MMSSSFQFLGRTLGFITGFFAGFLALALGLYFRLEFKDATLTLNDNYCWRKICQHGIEYCWHRLISLSSAYLLLVVYMFALFSLQATLTP